MRLTCLAALALMVAGPLGAETLTGGEWKVLTLSGTAMPSEGAPSIEFLPEGRVAGHSGCNRYMGSWLQDGDALQLSQMAGTRMACEPAKMELEGAMFEALAKVKRVALTPGGALELLGEDGLILRAQR